MDIAIEKCATYQDERGDLIQFVTNSFLKDNALSFGQIYILTFTKAGVIRGNHYHNRSSEVFCLVAGAVEIICEQVDTKERIHKTIQIVDSEYCKIFIGPRIAHAIKSLSNSAILVSFSSEEFSESDSDKFHYLLF